MLIVGLESPEGETHYVAAAFPSACGKTNLAMLVPPASQKGWNVWTVGDDIAWMRPGPDGRLWAINPEAGFFGVAPGTSTKTNRNAMATIERNSIFTNVAVTEDGCPWWEGIDGPVPEHLTDWRGRPWQRGSSEKAAHPNSRFTAPASQCPSISPKFEPTDSALVFAGVAPTAPLVVQAFDRPRRVRRRLVASETRPRRPSASAPDPMAMLPFCGYNMADYWAHWLAIGRRTGAAPPAIFHVNWFRQNAEGKFIWPGFGENMRVLRWIVDRCKGSGKAVDSPIGQLPAPGAIDTNGLDVDAATMTELLSVSRDDWRAEADGIGEFFAKFGSRLPAEMERQRQALVKRLG
jgi:phosphoenolpyruvate carboxykinase (GTP)